MNKQNIYFSSDFHYGHKNITGPKVSNWKSGYRNFNSIQEMNEAIIHSVNSIIKPQDVLYYLGDWSFGGEYNIQKLREQLKVKTIHFIKGNHDQHIHEHKHLFTSIQDYLEIKIEGQMIVLFHYPIYDWHKTPKSWHLCGHSHGNCKYSHPKTSQYKILDIGWDNFRKPLEFSEVRGIMNKKQNKSHH